MRKCLILINSILFAVACLSVSHGGQVSQEKPKPNLTATSQESERRDQPVTKEDLLILKRADEILSDETKWNRNDTRICKPEDKTWSLFCALQKACVELVGEYQHRRAAIQEVRFVIEEVADITKLGGHRLMGYNNLATTQFKDIKKVLKTATDKVAARLNEKK
jgi:hypothetical protein